MAGLMTLESRSFPFLYLFVFLFGVDLSCRELFDHFTVWHTSQLMITDQVSFYKTIGVALDNIIRMP